MGLSQLEYLDLCAGRSTKELDYPMFPFHPSLRVLLSRLNQIRILHLHNFRFSHLVEFRRLICGFGGIRHLVAIFVKFGKDNLGDFRPIHRTKEWQIPTKVSWLLLDRSFGNRERPQEGDDEVYTPLLWIASIPNPHRVITTSSLKATYPVLTPHIANAISRITHLGESFGHSFPDTWYWRRKEGSTDSRDC